LRRAMAGYCIIYARRPQSRSIRGFNSRDRLRGPMLLQPVTARWWSEFSAIRYTAYWKWVGVESGQTLSFGLHETEFIGQGVG